MEFVAGFCNLESLSAGGGKAPKKKTNSPPKMHSGNTTMVASYHMKNSSPTMLPQRAMSLVPFQVQMPPDQALFSQVASIVDRLPVDRRLHTMQEVPAMTHMLQHSVMQQQQQQIQQQPQQQTVLNITLQVTSEIYWVFCQNHKFPKDFHYRF